jgi:hypothetical protein
MTSTLTNTGVLLPINTHSSWATVQNGGYTVSHSSSPYNIVNGGNISSAGMLTINTLPPPTIQITGVDYSLTISHTGEISWTGSLSKSTQHFIKSFAANIDIETAGKVALAKTYKRAVEHCLKTIQSMDKDDAISALKNEIDARMSHLVIESLMAGLDE